MKKIIKTGFIYLMLLFVSCQEKFDVEVTYPDGRIQRGKAEIVSVTEDNIFKINFIPLDENTVFFSWNKNEEPDLAGYILHLFVDQGFRSPDTLDGGAVIPGRQIFNHLKAISLIDNHFAWTIDTTVTKFMAYVVAVDTAGNESAPSDSVRREI